MANPIGDAERAELGEITVVEDQDELGRSSPKALEHMAMPAREVPNVARLEIVGLSLSKIRRVQLRRLEHDDNRSDTLRGSEFREEDFPELQKLRAAGSES